MTGKLMPKLEDPELWPLGQRDTRNTKFWSLRDAIHSAVFQWAAANHVGLIGAERSNDVTIGGVAQPAAARFEIEDGVHHYTIYMTGEIVK